MDAATRDLFQAIHDALADVNDWHASAAWSATNAILAGGDPGATADWLRDFVDAINSASI